MRDLTICITASVRQNAVQRLINSLKDKTDMGFNLLVVNNSDPYTNRTLNRPENLSLDISKSNISWCNIKREMSISEHRKIALDTAQSRYVWLLDDDVVLTEDTVSSLYSKLSNSHKVDLISCVWRDLSDHRPNDRRPVGYLIHTIDGDEYNIYDELRIHPSTFETGNNNIISLDMVQGGTAMIDTEALKNIEWDPDYNHYYEQKDYFMQCKHHNINIWCDLTTSIRHSPLEYPDNTLRHNSNSENDKERFEKKWRVRITEQTYHP